MSAVVLYTFNANMKRVLSALVLWVAVTSTSLCAKNSPHGFSVLFGDQMVLQGAPAKANVFGPGPDNCSAVVTVSNIHSNTLDNGNVYHGKCEKGPDNKSRWLVTLDPVDSTDPFEITVEFIADGRSLTTASIQNVHFGDVWLCSGQSNMQFTTDMVMNASDILANASHYSNIRVFTVSEQQSSTPLYDVTAVEEPWSVSSRESVGHQPWKYFSAVCWLYGRELSKGLGGGRYIGLIASDWGGTPVEAWSSPDALSRCNTHRREEDESEEATIPGAVGGPNKPSVLWNAMINPLLNMTFKGAIWYQGEANAAEPNTYNCTFPAMIQDWRKKFHEGSRQQTDEIFPFGFVQLAPNRKDNIVEGFPDIRWHQTADMGYVPNALMPRTFMAVALDLPDYTSPYGSIHPRYKVEVARRLALSGLAVAYDKPVHFQGPKISAYYVDMDVRGSLLNLTLEFDNGTTQLDVRSPYGYELCCTKDNQTYCESATDEKWTAVTIIGSGDHYVALGPIKGSACEASWITGLRYNWRESPCPLLSCAVYSHQNNLPAPPILVMGLINAPQNRRVSVGVNGGQ